MKPPNYNSTELRFNLNRRLAACPVYRFVSIKPSAGNPNQLTICVDLKFEIGTWRLGSLARSFRQSLWGPRTRHLSKAVEARGRIAGVHVHKFFRVFGETDFGPASQIGRGFD